MTWDELFFNLIKEYKLKSKDPSSQFACLIINPDKSIVASGFNGFPRGVNDDAERYANRELKYKLVSHAEANGICQAAKHGIALDGCSIYVESYPCSTCCKLIIQSGIKEIVLNGDSEIHNDTGPASFRVRWAEEIKMTEMMCQEAQVSIRVYHKDAK